MEPENVLVLSNLGFALQAKGKYAESQQQLQKAIAIQPDFIDAHINLGNTYKYQFKLDEAAECYENALKLDGQSAKAHSNLGAVLHTQNRLEQAVASLQRAISIDPDHVEAYRNLAASYLEIGKTEMAIASYRQAIAKDPNDATSHYNLSFALLGSWQIREGLEEYEWRWRCGDFLSKRRNFSKPRWDGTANLQGKTLLLWSEQGVGDMLVWAFYLPRVLDQAEKCILECQPKLVPLVQRSFPRLDVRPVSMTRDAVRDDFDFHLPMGSLFQRIQPDINEISKVNSYLTPDPQRVEFWRSRLNGMGAGLKIGISWRSPSINPSRSKNYIELEEFAPIFTRHPDATYVNLECRNYQDDLVMAKERFGITVHDFEDLDQYDDLDDVAAISQALDVVISVNTAAAAISAGVGTATWILIWKQSSWNNILFSPRVAKVELFSRNSWEPWDEAILAVAERLGSAEF